MPVYRNFDEMAADNMNQSVQSSGNAAFNDTALNRGRDAAVMTCNYYGWGMPVSSNVVRELGISIDSEDFPDDSWERETWEDMKRRPLTVPVGITGNASNGDAFDAFKADLNWGTGELSVNGQSK